MDPVVPADLVLPMDQALPADQVLREDQAPQTDLQADQARASPVVRRRGSGAYFINP